MRSFVVPALFSTLILACSTGPAPEEAPPIAPGSFKYFGKMSYDGIHLAITDCEGRVYWLEDALFEGAIEEVKKIKMDPAYAVWIQVETHTPFEETNGRPMVLKSGTLGSTHEDPCPK